jgi:malonate transporter and related proteins
MLLTQWPLLLALVVPMLGVYGLSYRMQRRLFGLMSAPASVQALTVAFPNFAAAGLPLIAAVFGPSQLIDVAWNRVGRHRPLGHDPSSV